MCHKAIISKKMERARIQGFQMIRRGLSSFGTVVEATDHHSGFFGPREGASGNPTDGA
jgi:hypothetical protein